MRMLHNIQFIVNGDLDIEISIPSYTDLHVNVHALRGQGRTRTVNSNTDTHIYRLAHYDESNVYCDTLFHYKSVSLLSDIKHTHRQCLESFKSISAVSAYVPSANSIETVTLRT